MLHPLGLEGPLGWLAEQLEESDEEQLEWLWDLAPTDLPAPGAVRRGLRATLPSVEPRVRIPGAAQSLEMSGGAGRAGAVVVTAAVLLAGLAGYDFWGFQRRPAFARDRDNAAPAVARRVVQFPAWHPSLALFWPALARQARLRETEWTVKAADVQVANGTAGPDLRARLTGLRTRCRNSLPAIRKVEQPREWSGTTSAGRPCRPRPCRSRRSTTPRSRSPCSMRFFTSFPTRPTAHEVMALATLAQDRARPPAEPPCERKLVDDLTRCRVAARASSSPT